MGRKGRVSGNRPRLAPHHSSRSALLSACTIAGVAHWESPLARQSSVDRHNPTSTCAQGAQQPSEARSKPTALQNACNAAHELHCRSQHVTAPAARHTTHSASLLRRAVHNARRDNSRGATALTKVSQRGRGMSSSEPGCAALGTFQAGKRAGQLQQPWPAPWSGCEVGTSCLQHVQQQPACCLPTQAAAAAAAHHSQARPCSHAPGSQPSGHAAQPAAHSLRQGGRGSAARLTTTLLLLFVVALSMLARPSDAAAQRWYCSSVNASNLTTCPVCQDNTPCYVSGIKVKGLKLVPNPGLGSWGRG